MSEILLTYIVPVYNTERYLEKCLRSIVGQGIDADAYEVLVMDDGSTDGSKAVAEAFIRENPQVRLFTAANAGVSAARNRALDAARGRYVQFVDSDDFLLDGMMGRLLQRALDDRLDVLVFNYNWADPDGTITRPSCDAAATTSPMTTGVEYLSCNTMSPYVWRYLISRDYLEKNQWRFDPSLIVCEDGDLIARFMLNASRVASDASAPYCYVNRGDSAMHNQDKEHLRRRIFSQIDSAASIDATIRKYETESGVKAPASVSGLRNVYLYFSMTKALTCGCVDEALTRIRQAGLYPFPCVGPEANYVGPRWKIIHRLMMTPALWSGLSKLYCMIKK